MIFRETQLLEKQFRHIYNRFNTYMFILNTKNQIVEVNKSVFHNSQDYYCFLWKQRYDVLFSNAKQIIVANTK